MSRLRTVSDNVFDPQVRKRHTVTLADTCMSATRPRPNASVFVQMDVIHAERPDSARFQLKMQFSACILLNLANSVRPLSSTGNSSAFMWTGLGPTGHG